MARRSFLNQTPRARFIQLTEDLLDICNGNTLAAVLLHEIDYICGYRDTLSLDLSTRALSKSTIGLGSHARIQRGLRKLVDLGFIEWTVDGSRITLLADVVNAALERFVPASEVEQNVPSLERSVPTLEQNVPKISSIPRAREIGFTEGYTTGSPLPPTADADEPLIDYLHSLAKYGRQKPVFNPKELAYLRERDSPEMRAAIAERVEASDAANIREVILAAVGYTGRKAPERKGYNRAAPRQASNGLSRAFDAPRIFDRAPPAARRPTQAERMMALFEAEGTIEDDDEEDQEAPRGSHKTGGPANIHRATQ